MDNRYLENVVNEIKPFLDENGFSKFDEGFKNDSKAVIIDYDEPRQMFLLKIADVNENAEIGEYKEVSSWLFDDSQNQKDAEAVGIDFTNTLRKELGIKRIRVANTDDVELPTATKSGNTTITGFTKKMLDIFPLLKAEYKNHIAVYGNFLYLNFYGEHLVPSVKKVYLTGTSKQIKKFTDVMRDAYVKGDKETVNAVIAVLSAVSYSDKEAGAKIKEALAEDKHFCTSIENFVPILAKNKKLLSTLVK